MSNLTISQKLLGLFLINIIIIVVIIANSYVFTNNNASNLKSLKEKALPVSSLYTNNLYLLKAIRNAFLDSSVTNEKEILMNTLKFKKKVINNLKKLNKYDVTTKKYEEGFNKYFDYGYSFSSNILEGKAFNMSDAMALQEYSNEIFLLFEEVEYFSRENIVLSLKEVSNNTNSFFKNSIIISLIGFIVMILAGLYVHRLIYHRFKNILKSVENLTKEDPDFTLRIDSEYNDEVGQLINLYNKLSDKLEIAYHQNSQNFLTEIAETQKEVIFTMGSIAESRSKETGDHVKRVAEYSKVLALYYGLNEDEAEMLKQASPMHDIGKVAIPDEILNKPGRLDDEEKKIMEEHVILGYDMLKHSHRALLKTAAIVALEHHEKWDGTGYPNAKIGEDIHIYGRITALADVFDALGSDRVYKKAWNDEKIFKLFKEERGKHFDPKLMDIFFEHIDEFLIIRDKFKKDKD